MAVPRLALVEFSFALWASTALGHRRALVYARGNSALRHLAAAGVACATRKAQPDKTISKSIRRRNEICSVDYHLLCRERDGANGVDENRSWPRRPANLAQL